MWKILMIFALALIDSYMMVDYHSKYRPQLHYSVPKGWLNDPNGFVYYNGYYHLFYQHNPNDTKWGPMHWGHTVSKDLIHWSNKEIALKPFNLGVIYSGCAITDRRNVTGLQRPGGPDPLIIIYTIDDSGFEQQGLAYSIDNGETYLQYEKNPIIANPNIRDFRDPNVFFYDNKYYVMVLAAGDRAQFFKSTNLIDWEFLSEFGNDPGQGERRGIWECPSFFELEVEPINGEPQKNKWVLVVSLNIDNDAAKRGSVTEYFIGHFNGKDFINSNSNNTILYSDYGPDNYAAIPLSENPNPKETVLIGWLSNWMYGTFTPTDTWRGQITLPRKMGIERVRNDYRLTQLPIDQIYKQRDYSNGFLMKSPHTYGDNTVFLPTQDNPNLRKFNLFNIEIKFEIDGKFKGGEFGLRLSNYDSKEHIRLGYNITTDTYYFDRRQSGMSIHENFLRQTETERNSDKARVFEWTVILDTSAVEFFADGGLNVFSGLFYPTNNKYYNEIAVYALNLQADDSEKLSQLKISSMAIYPLNTIWK